MNEISDKHMGYLMKLSMLHLDEDEKNALKDKLNHMLGFVEQVKQVDVTDVEPLFTMTEEINRLREDIPQENLTHDRALKESQGPFKNDVYFSVVRNK